MTSATRDHGWSRMPKRTGQRLAVATWLLSVPLLLTGCETTVEPEPLAVDMSGQESVVGTWVDSGALLHCTVEVALAATGEGSATWRDGEVEYQDPELGLQSSDQSAAQLAETWGAAGIAAGETLDATYPSIARGEHSGTIRVALEDADDGIYRVSHTYDCVAP